MFSFKNRIVILIVLVVLLSVLMMYILSNVFISKKEKIGSVFRSIETSYILLLKDIEVQNKFWVEETIDSSFYLTGVSNCLESHHLFYKQQKKVLKEIQNSANDFLIDSELEHIEKQIDSSHLLFQKIVQLVHVKGYKDWGLEGRMRDDIHFLQAYKYTDKVLILEIRRREKDYLLRKETKYFDMVNAHCATLEKMYLENSNITHSEKDTLVFLLHNYLKDFSSMVTIDKKIGYKSEGGLLFLNRLKTHQIISKYDSLIAKMKESEKELTSGLTKRYVLFIGLLFSIGVLLSLLFSKYISIPLKSLSHHMTTFINSGFLSAHQFTYKYNDVIGRLNNSFNLLSVEIKSHINHLNEKVEERTKELNKQKQLVEKKNYWINEQNEELMAKNTLIQSQKEFIESQYKSIVDSINYAERIQKSILPNLAEIKRFFNDSFVLHLPRDIVSGDIYFFDRFVPKNFNNEVGILVVADCTGHGVPGALVSILCNNGIREAIKHMQIVSPGELINYLNNYIYLALNNFKRSEVSDGVDLSVCLIDYEKMTLVFAGIKQKIFLIRNNKMHEYKGDNYHLGIENTNKFFHDYVIKMEKGDKFYLHSDGYQDQFGGVLGKKFKVKRLKEELLSPVNSMMEKRTQLLDAFNDWKGCCEQVDDILIIGIEI